MLMTLCFPKIETTLEPNVPVPPMQRIFFIIVQQMQLQNQFITLQELTHLHFQKLLARHDSSANSARQASSNILSKVTAQLLQGYCEIAQQSQDTSALLDQSPQTESQKRLALNRIKQEQRRMINQMLYGHNKNKISEEKLKITKRLLSQTEHQKFIKTIKEKNQQIHHNRLQRQQKRQQFRQTQQQTEKKSAQAKRLQSIERKREAIKQNLRKMRQNHDKMVLNEQQSRAIFNKLRQKKRLYQELKQLQQERSLQIQKQAEKRLRQIKEASKLDIHQLTVHEKQYLEWRKQKNNPQNSRQKQISGSQSMHNYHPPSHSLKINRFLEQEINSFNKFDLNKKKIQEKLKKIAEYSTLVKVKYKPRSQVSKTIIGDNDKSSQSDHLSLREQRDRIKLGNEYLKQANQNLRRRAKTQEQFNPEKQEIIQVKIRKEREKAFVSSLDYIPENKRKEHIERMKRKELQKVFREQYKIEGDRLQRLKIADQRLSIELKKKEEELKLRYSTQTSDNALQLLLGTIKAKINLLDTT